MPQYSTVLRNARLNEITTRAGATAFLKVYTGPPPNKNSAPTGTLLVNLPLANPIAPATLTATLTLSPISPGVALASGVPGYARITSSDTDNGINTVIQLTAGVNSGEVRFDQEVTQGDEVTVTNNLFVISEGNP